jgi:hypothetical protein
MHHSIVGIFFRNNYFWYEKVKKYFLEENT